MPGQHALKLPVDRLHFSQTLRILPRIATHECLRCLDGSFRLDRPCLPQSENVRRQPVERVSLCRPGNDVKLHPALADIQVKQPVAVLVEVRLHRGEHERRVGGRVELYTRVAIGDGDPSP